MQSSDSDGVSVDAAVTSVAVVAGPKRLHFSNLPFRLREADLRALLTVMFCVYNNVQSTSLLFSLASLMLSIRVQFIMI